MQKQVFQSYLMVDPLRVLHISSSVCLFVREKPTDQVRAVNHECTDVCTLDVIQLE